MDDSEYEEIAEELQAILLLARGLSPLLAEEKVGVSLTHSELVTLQYLFLLGESDSFYSASDVALIFRIDRERVSHLLKRLEEPEKLVTRRHISSNRFTLELTERGREIAKRAIQCDVKDLVRILRLVKHEKRLRITKALLKEIRNSIVAVLPNAIKERKEKG